MLLSVANTIHAFVYTCKTLIVQSTYMIPIRVLLNVITLVHRMQSEVSTLLQCLIKWFLKRSYQKYSNYQNGVHLCDNINWISTLQAMISSVYAPGVRQAAIKAFFVIDKCSLTESLQANRFLYIYSTNTRNPRSLFSSELLKPTATVQFDIFSVSFHIVCSTRA